MEAAFWQHQSASAGNALDAAAALISIVLPVSSQSPGGQLSRRLGPPAAHAGYAACADRQSHPANCPHAVWEAVRPRPPCAGALPARQPWLAIRKGPRPLETPPDTLPPAIPQASLIYANLSVIFGAAAGMDASRQAMAIICVPYASLAVSSTLQLALLCCAPGVYRRRRTAWRLATRAFRLLTLAATFAAFGSPPAAGGAGDAAPAALQGPRAVLAAQLLLGPPVAVLLINLLQATPVATHPAYAAVVLAVYVLGWMPVAFESWEGPRLASTSRAWCDLVQSALELKTPAAAAAAAAAEASIRAAAAPG